MPASRRRRLQLPALLRGLGAFALVGREAWRQHRLHRPPPKGYLYAEYFLWNIYLDRLEIFRLPEYKNLID